RHARANWPDKRFGIDAICIPPRQRGGGPHEVRWVGREQRRKVNRRPVARPRPDPPPPCFAWSPSPAFAGADEFSLAPVTLAPAALHHTFPAEVAAPKPRVGVLSWLADPLANPPVARPAVPLPLPARQPAIATRSLPPF